MKTFNISGWGFRVFSIEKRLMEGQDIYKVLEDILSLRTEVEEMVREEAEKWIDGTTMKIRKFLDRVVSESR